MKQSIGIYLLGINVLAFWLYGMDKQRAKRHAWRIQEHTLLSVAAAGGSIGALLGMKVFHHKTRKLKFRIGVPVMLLIQLAVAALVMIQWGGLQ